MLYLVAPAQQHRKSVNSIWVAILSQNFTDTMAEEDDMSGNSSTNSINNTHTMAMPNNDGSLPNNDALRTDATDADLPSINGAASSGGTVDLTNNDECATLPAISPHSWS